MDRLRWSEPTRDDIPAWQALLEAIEAVDRRGEVLDTDDLADEFDSVWSDAEHNATFVWAGEDLVAFAWLRVVPGSRTNHRITLWSGVHPAWRGHGIGAALVEWQLGRAREVAPSLDPEFPVQLEADLAAHQQDAVALFAGAGFEPARWFMEVQRDLAASLPDTGVPAGLEVRPWDGSFDEASRLGHAEAFADHWGSEPRTPEEWRQWYTGHRGFRPDLSFVALDGEELAAFCLVGVYPQDWTSNGYRDAWVTTLGTRKAWRGRGAARALLVASMHAMAGAPDGLERASLGVDVENPTGALGLYTSVGFVEHRRTVVLQRQP
jgi:mycothiol synthase